MSAQCQQCGDPMDDNEAELYDICLACAEFDKTTDDFEDDEDEE